jgi:hypothetical protein
MATMTKSNAESRLLISIGQAGPDDLREFYNEIFPDKPVSRERADSDEHSMRQKLSAYIQGGLEGEEIESLWNVVFPRHRKVHYDYEAGLIRFDDRKEPVGQA